MDRTQVENYRVEEKMLSKLIYKKLGVLTVIQAPTTEFNSIYSEDMFIRPNSKAFVHVMHFLFTIYDINEFKKRFYWPLTDKQCESNFRSSTIEYLNYLNIKHNCKWINLNRSLVVMPGGYKFLLFLNDLLGFVAKELMRQREKYLPKNLILKDLNCNSELINLETEAKILKKNAVVYAESIDDQTKKYVKCTENIYNVFIKISRATKIPMGDLLNPLFLNELKKFVDRTFQKNIKNKIDNICNFEKYIDFIQENMQLSQNEKSPLQYDKNDLLFNEDLDEKKLVNCNDTNLANLMYTIMEVLPQLNKIISFTDEDSIEALQFQNEELKKLNNNTSETNLQLTELSTYMQTGIKTHLQTKQALDQQQLSSGLRAKYIETPPIRQNFSRTAITRLPMMEDNLGMNCSTGSANFTFADRTTVMNLPRSIIKSVQRATNKENNISKIFDPSEFLRDATKKNKSGKKKRNQSCINGIRNNYDDTPFKMTDSKTCEKIKHSKRISPFNHDTKKKLFPDKLINTSPAFQKIQHTSRYIEKLSTSPTGRLGPLVEIGHIPKIILNSMDENFGNFNSSENIIAVPEIDANCEIDPPEFKDKISNKPSNKKEEEKAAINQKKSITSALETEWFNSIQNANKMNSNFSFRILNEDIDFDSDLASICKQLNIHDNSASGDIFNTSDSVLNNIEM